jgi:acyl-CoA reductase-like NAD-dependent aldehyde dehydrogenase
MPSVFTHEFDTPVYKGRTQFNTGLFINGQFLDGSDNTYIECVIKKANDTIYGLAAYVFSQNVTKAIESAHKLKAGSVWVNMGGLVSPSVPFGGYKQSGIGRELGQYALDEYVTKKLILRTSY